jgi:TFIIF-interacting CTD phosphatase-like protein
MLGRGLDNVLIIASDAVNFKATPENGIVMNWGGNEKDRKLLDLSQILTEMFK